MRRYVDQDELLSSARELAERPSEAPPAVLRRAAAQLHELGLLHETHPAVAADLAAALSRDQRRALDDFAAREDAGHRSCLRGALDAIEQDREAMAVFPLLADDPGGAEALHRTAMEGLLARESLHGLAHARAAVAGAGAPSGLPDLDARLRELIPLLAPLEARRSQLAAELAPEVRGRHWWLSSPARVDRDDEEDEDDSAGQRAREAYGAWLDERADLTGRRPRLRLRPEERRALLATERGGNTLNYLVNEVASDPGPGAVAASLYDSEAALSLSQIRAAAPPPTTVPLADLWGAWKRRLAEASSDLRERCDRVALRSSATAPLSIDTPAPAPLALGAPAVAGFWAAWAFLDPVVGVVAAGSFRDPSTPDAAERYGAWLVLPRPWVTRLRRYEGAEDVPASAWAGGGVVWYRSPPVHEHLELCVVLREPDQPERSAMRRFTAPPGGTAPDALSVVLRLAAEPEPDPAAALQAWQALKPVLGEHDRAAAEGLVTTLRSS